MIDIKSNFIIRFDPILNWYWGEHPHQKKKSHGRVAMECVVSDQICHELGLKHKVSLHFAPF
ncbi:hypothetical protein LYNGBM3L_13420 [Moorena producens 3L]|uniref:Uncharacterized protein n=1 Tax=Moorena producens 3L TaxID=489825 RepID=F4XL08_9CYAN|nr:hypothetical protein LYNGBM3L_13420 [Moorena producens 3L]OLT66235.1 hypothetical protein BI334_15510 [Moorena producens 3L]